MPYALCVLYPPYVLCVMDLLDVLDVLYALGELDVRYALYGSDWYFFRMPWLTMRLDTRSNRPRTPHVRCRIGAGCVVGAVRKGKGEGGLVEAPRLSTILETRSGRPWIPMRRIGGRGRAGLALCFGRQRCVWPGTAAGAKGGAKGGWEACVESASGCKSGRRGSCEKKCYPRLPFF